MFWFTGDSGRANRCVEREEFDDGSLIRYRSITPRANVSDDINKYGCDGKEKIIFGQSSLSLW